MDTATLNNPPGRRTAETAAADRRLRIYVCSPYRPRMESAEQAKRELADNIDRAKTACRLVADLGAIPICSHLFCTQFLDDSIASEREQGRRIGLEMLKDADELWCFSEYISEGDDGGAPGSFPPWPSGPDVLRDRRTFEEGFETGCQRPVFGREWPGWAMMKKVTTLKGQKRSGGFSL